MSTAYEEPQFSSPDDTPPVGAYRGEPVVLSFRDKQNTAMAHDDPMRFEGSIRRARLEDQPVYTPSLTVRAYVAVVLTLAVVVVLWLCAGRPALTGWQL